MNAVPLVRKFMTPMPHTIGAYIEIERARQMMRLYHIRHLPVLLDGELVGVLSDRDVKLAQSFRGPGKLTVEDVMTPDPYVVSEETGLDEVVGKMAESKYGCALVRNLEGKLIGIFTDIDALHVLASMLKTQAASRAA